jgi:hypothetical protein
MVETDENWLKLIKSLSIKLVKDGKTTSQNFNHVNH